VGIELVGENMFFHHLIQFPTFSAHLDVLESELKSAMGIYFDCQFQLTPPAGDVGIELYGENLIFQQVAPTRDFMSGGITFNLSDHDQIALCRI
jgi:hypothetical protein